MPRRPRHAPHRELFFCYVCCVLQFFWGGSLPRRVPHGQNRQHSRINSRNDSIKGHEEMNFYEPSEPSGDTEVHQLSKSWRKRWRHRDSSDSSLFWRWGSKILSGLLCLPVALYMCKFHDSTWALSFQILFSASWRLKMGQAVSVSATYITVILIQHTVNPLLVVVLHI